MLGSQCPYRNGGPCHASDRVSPRKGVPFQVGPAGEPANGQRGLRPVSRPAPGQCTISVRQVWSLTGQARRYANPDGAGRARGPGRARPRSRGSYSDLLQDGQSTVKVTDACGHSSRLFTSAAVSGPAAPTSGVNPSESSAKQSTARCWLCSFALYFSFPRRDTTSPDANWRSSFITVPP